MNAQNPTWRQEEALPKNVPLQGALMFVDSKIWDCSQKQHREPVHPRHNVLLYETYLGHPILRKHYPTCSTYLLRSIDPIGNQTAAPSAVSEQSLHLCINMLLTIEEVDIYLNHHQHSPTITRCTLRQNNLV